MNLATFSSAIFGVLLPSLLPSVTTIPWRYTVSILGASTILGTGGGMSSARARAALAVRRIPFSSR
jgi:hypothetical protein